MNLELPPVITIEALRSVPLFASLDDGAARALRELLAMREVPPETLLFRHGDTGDAMYLILSGRVRISVRDTEGKDISLAELARGDFFGEMALLDGKSRSADAVVVEKARLAVLARDDFLSFVRRNPDVALEMLSAIANRLRRTDNILRHRVSRNANEEEARRLTLADRMADMIARFGGSWTFIGAALLFLAVWVILNTWLLRERAFDVFPYVLLNLVLSMITGFQAPFIMMSQKRQAEKDRLHSDLDYQVNLKNELAIAEVLRRIDVLESERLPILFEKQNARLKSGPLVQNSQVKSTVADRPAIEAPESG
jgi:uncharacterized membrane protein